VIGIGTKESRGIDTIVVGCRPQTRNVVSAESCRCGATHVAAGGQILCCPPRPSRLSEPTSSQFVPRPGAGRSGSRQYRLAMPGSVQPHAPPRTPGAGRQHTDQQRYAICPAPAAFLRLRAHSRHAGCGGAALTGRVDGWRELGFPAGPSGRGRSSCSIGDAARRGAAARSIRGDDGPVGGRWITGALGTDSRGGVVFRPSVVVIGPPFTVSYVPHRCSHTQTGAPRPWIASDNYGRETQPICTTWLGSASGQCGVTRLRARHNVGCDPGRGAPVCLAAPVGARKLPVNATDHHNVDA